MTILALEFSLARRSAALARGDGVLLAEAADQTGGLGTDALGLIGRVLTEANLLAGNRRSDRRRAGAGQLHGHPGGHCGGARLATGARHSACSAWAAWTRASLAADGMPQRFANGFERT